MTIEMNGSLHADTRNIEELSELALVASDASYKGRLATINEVLSPFNDTPQYSNPQPPFAGSGTDYSITSSNYLVARTFDDSRRGFKAIAYRDVASHDLIIAFAGTDGPDLKDWWGNLFHYGWNQWNQNSDDVIGYLTQVFDTDPSIRIHFTGQSLGGALAQYAAYQYVDQQGNAPGFNKQNLSLVTFNALGGTAGLNDNITGFNASLLNGLGQGVHYVVQNDVIHLLGNGDVGGVVKQFDWVDPNATSPAFNKLDPIDAHRIESAFYRYLNPAKNFFAEAHDVPLGSGLSIPTVQKLASAYGNLEQRQATTGSGAVFAFVAGLIPAGSLAPASEVNALMRTVFTAYRDSGEIAPLKAELLLDTDWSKMFKSVAGVTGNNPARVAATFTGSILLGYLASALGKSANYAQSVVFDQFGIDESVPMEDRPWEVWAAQSRLLPDQISPGTPLSQAFIDREELAKRMTSGQNWLTGVLSYVANAAVNAGLTGVALSTFVSEATKQAFDSVKGSAVKTGVSIADSERMTALALKDFGQAIANTVTDVLNHAATSTVTLVSDSYQATKELADGLVKGLNDQFRSLLDDAQASDLKDDAQRITEDALQRPWLLPFLSKPSNPYNDPSSNPDTASVVTQQIDDGESGTYTIFLPYEAGEGGQRIKITLAGADLSNLSVLSEGEEIPVTNGEFELTVAQGRKQVSFAVQADDDLTDSGSVSVSATLIGSDGQATHETHLEANLQLQHEAPVFDGGVITNTSYEILENGNFSFLIGQSRVQLNGAAFSEIVIGDHASEMINASAGHNLIIERQFPGQPSAPYQEADRIKAGNDSDIITGYLGNQIDAGDGDNFVQANYSVDLRTDIADQDGNVLLSVIGYYPGVFSAVAGAMAVRDFSAGADPQPVSFDGSLGFNYRLGFGTEPVTGTGYTLTPNADGSAFVTFDTGTPYQYLRAAFSYSADLNNTQDVQIKAGTGNDWLFGAGGADSIYGGDGNDHIGGSAGDDTLEGQGGDDQILAGLGDDFVQGGEGDDRLWGEAGADELDGGDGDDFLEGDTAYTPYWLAGNDFLDGGAGDDTLLGDSGDDELYGGEGTDSLDGGDGNDYLDGESGDDTMQGGTGDDTMFGGDGMDDLGGGTGDDYLDGEAGDDTLEGGDGDDTIWAGEGDDELTGGAGDDELHGEDGDDALEGGDGDDVLEGGAGDDTLEGGAGADTYDIEFGDGNDTIDDSAADQNMLELGVGISLENLVAAQSGGDDLVISGDGAGDTITIHGGLKRTISQISFADGTDLSLKDFLKATLKTSVTLTGNGGEFLHGGAAGDFIHAGLNDVVVGGQGNDVLDAGDSSTFGFGTGDGNDIVHGGGAKRFDFSLDSSITTTGLVLERPDPANSDVSTPRDLLLRYGTAGDSILIEDSSNSIYYTYTVTDPVYGFPTALSQVQLLEQSGLALDWIGTANAETVYSTKFDDHLQGMDGDDALAGLDGNDVLEGGGGQDTLDGGQGNDVLDGGADQDLLRGGGGDDQYVFNLGDSPTGAQDVIDDAQGNNAVVFGAGISVADISAEMIQGDDGDSYLALTYSGTDQFLVKQNLSRVQDGSLSFSFADGTQLTAAELLSSAFSEPLEFVGGSVAVSVTGSRFDDLLTGSDKGDFLDGGLGNDQLRGGAGVDTLVGGGGDDYVDGGTDDDTLRGGLGADVYRVGLGMGKDLIVEDPSDGAVSTLKLDPDVAINDFNAARFGTDLYLHFKSSREGVLIREFFDAAGAPSALWQVEDASGATTPLASVLAILTEQSRSATISAVFDDYRSRLLAYYRSALAQAGYSLGVDGKYHRESIYQSEFALQTTNSSLDISLGSESSDDAYITRQTPGYDFESRVVNSSFSPYTYQKLVTTTSTFVDYSNGGNLESARRGSVVVHKTVARGGRSVPVVGAFGQPTYDNPTGTSTQGFFVYPVASPGPTYETVTIQRSIVDIVATVTANIDEINGGASDNTIDLNAGNAYYSPQPWNGFTLVDAGAGNDTIIAQQSPTPAGIYIPNGGGVSSTDVPGVLMYGGEGNDTLVGGVNADVLIGGTGDDVMKGGDSNDTYLIFPGDGNDVIYDRGRTISGVTRNNVVEMPDGVTLDDLTYAYSETVMDGRYTGLNFGDMDVQSVYRTLKVSWTDGSITIVLPHTDQGAGLGIDVLNFADGSRATMSQLIGRAGSAPTFDPQNQDNSNPGISYGGDGNDVVGAATSTVPSAGDFSFSIGGKGRDTLVGGSGDDALVGGELIGDQSFGGFSPRSDMWDEGNVYHGGGGDDLLLATAGSDRFEYDSGDGLDTVSDMQHESIYFYYGGRIGVGDFDLAFPQWDDAAAVNPTHRAALFAGHDTLSFGQGIGQSDVVVLRASGQGGFVPTSDLLFMTAGGGVRFQSYYNAELNQLNRVEFADGSAWGASVIASKAATAKRARLGNDFDDDFLFGNSGNDGLFGFGGSDYLDGRGGNDDLRGGTGSDIYVLDSGHITVREASDPDGLDTDTLQVGADASDVSVIRQGDNLILTVNSTGASAAVNWYTDATARLEQVVFQDGTVWNAAMFEAQTGENPNHAPVIVNPVTDQAANEDSLFTYTVPANTFSDSDLGDALTYAASQANGSALPSWLTFDAASRAFSGTPLQADVGSIDIRVRATDGGGLHADDTFALDVANVNDAPVVAAAASQTLTFDQTVDASSLFSVSDEDGDTPTRYQFWDSTAGGGHFVVNGVEQGVNVAIDVPASDLANTQFLASSSIGSDLVWVRANDGQAWGEWKSWTMSSWPHATNAAPVVSAGDGTLLTNGVVAADSLFSVSDGDSDPIAQYEFWDDVNGGGYWRVNGVQQAAAATISVAAADLANTEYVGGAEGGTERVWVRANDGMEWGAWKPWNMTTALHIPNAAPVVTASNQTVVLNQAVDAGSLFSVTDADSDSITKYEFWDSTAGKGHFTVNGVEQDVNVAIAVSAADLPNTQFVGSATNGSDTVWVRANDGQVWSDWKSWNMASAPHVGNSAPVISASDATILTDDVVSADSLFSVADGDNDPIAQYELWDDVAGGGYWAVNGVPQGAGQTIAVSADDLANTEYVGASTGTERVWARANDGIEWGAWKSWNITTALHIPNSAPMVSAQASQTVLLNQAVDVSGLFNVNDADYDEITSYEFWDSTSGGGHFTVNGVEQGVNVSIHVSDFDLGNTRFVGGASSGTDTVWARANDGQTWSDWKSWTMQSSPHATNGTPVVTAPNSGLLRNEAVAASDLFSTTDIDNDPIAQYEFWDDVNGGGYWRVNGVQQAAGQSIGISAADLANTQYVGGANAGTEQVWVRANDGIGWGAWKNWLMSTEGGMLRGGTGPDTLNGDPNTPILEGGAGDDTLNAGPPNSLLSGGDGSDTLHGGDGNDIVAGGAGNDTIDTGAGSNVITFNREGGTDILTSPTGSTNTLSLGGGIGYDDLSLSKDGNDLVVHAGGDDNVVLKDWYAGNKNVVNMQVILDAMATFDAGSSDPLANKPVQNFDFLGIVNAFDQALAQAPGMTSWAMTNALLANHLAGSDDAAIGGDLAYWYGHNGGFTGIGQLSAQQLLGNANFGAEAQTLHAFSGLQEGLTKLA